MVSRLPPLRPHHWTLPRNWRRWYHPLRRDSRRGPWHPKPFLHVICGVSIRLSGWDRFGQRHDIEFEAEYPLGFSSPDGGRDNVRLWRRRIRAYMRRIGLPGRTIRRVCGLLDVCSPPMPCPYSAVRAAIALDDAP